VAILERYWTLTNPGAAPENALGILPRAVMRIEVSIDPPDGETRRRHLEFEIVQGDA
jgi:hypothetical protein